MADQIVKTTLVINADDKGSMDTVGAVLDELIKKAERLSSILENLKLGDLSGLGGAKGGGGGSGGASWKQPKPEDVPGATKPKVPKTTTPDDGGGGGGEGGEGGASGGKSTDEKEQPLWRKYAQKGQYAAAVGLGMAARSATSKMVGYEQGMQSARSIETGATYSGDAFQMAQGLRQAEATRQHAAIRTSKESFLGVGGSGLQMAGTGAMMLGGPVGLIAGVVALAVGGVLQYASGKGVAKLGADIDVETTKQTSALKTLQQIQTQSMQMFTMQRGTIAFGGGREGQYNAFLDQGANLGFTPQESQTMTNKFLSSGGQTRTMKAKWGTKGQEYVSPNQIDYQRYQLYGNVAPETLGGFNRGFYPGGGADASRMDTSGYEQMQALTTVGVPNDANFRAGSAQKMALNATTNAAINAGIPTARWDEYHKRAGGFMQRYAERNVNIDPLAQAKIDSYIPQPIKGLARTAGAENVASFGMSMADQLNEMVMPQQLARGIMMADVVGEGGEIDLWKRKMSDPIYMAKRVAGMNEEMPDMLKGSFIQTITGLFDAGEFKKGAGFSVDTSKPEKIYKDGDEEIIKPLKKFSEIQRLYIKSIAEATDVLNIMTKAIEKALKIADDYELTAATTSK